MKIKLIGLLLLFGCSHYGSLNLQRHEFAGTPQKIIWYHVPGLHEEHISLLKFFYRDSNLKTSFEKMTCMGKMWRYNLYDTRPSSNSSFLSQAMGTKNVGQSCDVYSFKPIWSYLEDLDYSTGFLEREMRRTPSVLENKTCNTEAVKNSTLQWRMSENVTDLKSKLTFHTQEEFNFKKGGVYYDKSCSKKGCFNTLITNIRGLYEKHFSSRSNFFFAIKDNKILEDLKAKKVSHLKESLNEVDQILEYLLSLQKANPDLLVVITTSEPIPLELPKSGKDWSQYIKGKGKLLYKNSSLQSTVWAKGVRSENFCGIFEEAELMQRVMNNYTKVRLEVFGLPIM